MKIGILTLPFNNNYGGYLQAIALTEILRKLGHHPVIINRRNNPVSFKSKIKIFALGIRGLINKKKPHPFFADSEKVFYRRGENMIPFAKKYLQNITQPIFSAQELCNYREEFDAFIVGSDQVWRPIYVPEVEDFFFRFLGSSNKKRIAYAASFGNTTPEYTDTQILECGELLKQFTAVSLREESGKDVMSNFKWNYPNTQIVLDPTLLMDRDYYIKMINNPTLNSTGKLFCYILDRNPVTDEAEKRIVGCQRLEPIYILDRTKWETRHYVMPSIQEWLYGFYTSDYILTDSYHGTVFSIIFNKPFVVYANKRRGIDRFETLLRYFNLENRLVMDLSDIDIALASPVDWSDVRSRLQTGREHSINFLKASLI